MWPFQAFLSKKVQILHSSFNIQSTALIVLISPNDYVAVLSVWWLVCDIAYNATDLILKEGCPICTFLQRWGSMPTLLYLYSLCLSLSFAKLLQVRWSLARVVGYYRCEWKVTIARCFMLHRSWSSCFLFISRENNCKSRNFTSSN